MAEEGTIEMPEFTDEQINHLLEMAYTRFREAVHATLPVDGLASRRKGRTAEYHKMARYHVQMLGFMFEALGLWSRFPAGVLIAAMRGDDPFDRVYKCNKKVED